MPAPTPRPRPRLQELRGNVTLPGYSSLGTLHRVRWKPRGFKSVLYRLSLEDRKPLGKVNQGVKTRKERHTNRTMLPVPITPPHRTELFPAPVTHRSGRLQPGFQVPAGAGRTPSPQLMPWDRGCWRCGGGVWKGQGPWAPNETQMAGF